MSFRKLIEQVNGVYYIKLGYTVYSTTRNLKTIKIERRGVFVELTQAELNAKPWIVRNMQQEIAYQRRKEMAIMLDQPCFKREQKYSRNQRIAYNNAKSNGVI